MKKRKILFFILINIVLFTFTIYGDTEGFVNDNNVRVRIEPLITAKIVTKLNQSDSVIVIGRTKNREKIGSMEPYWLNVKTEDFSGWIYGYFINILGLSYDNLPVLYNDDFFNPNYYQRYLLSNTDIKILEQSGIDYKRNDTELYKNLILDENPMISYFSNERMLISENLYWAFSNYNQLYTNLKKQFRLERSIYEYLSPTLEVGILETDRYFPIESSVVSELVQINYSNELSISEIINLEDGACFWIDGLSGTLYPSTINISALIFYIQKVSSSIFPELINKFEISSIVISPYNLTSIREKSEKAFKNLVIPDNNSLITTKRIIYGSHLP